LYDRGCAGFFFFRDQTPASSPLTEQAPEEIKPVPHA
jgi:hypothetical protein